MYTLYGSRKTRCFRAAWMLEELGVPYKVVPEAPHAPQVCALNPTGKVPVMVADDLVLTDSTAILTFLADKHSALTEAPCTTARAAQDAVTQRLLDELEGPLWNAAKHSYILPECERVSDIIPANAREFVSNLDAIARDMTGDYAAGDKFSIADIICVQLLSWAIFMQFPITNEKIKAYSKRMRARPAFQAVNAEMKAEAPLKISA